MDSAGGSNCCLVWTDSVSDGSAHAENVVGTEAEAGAAGCIRVVQNVVVPNFRTEKHVSPNVIAEASASVNQEVIGTVVASTEIQATGRILIGIKARTLPSNSAEHIEAHLLGEARLVDAIEGELDRAVGLTSGTANLSLARFPVYVERRAEALVEDDVRANIQIKASLLGADHAAARIRAAVRRRDKGAGRRRRREQCSAANSGVALLS